MDPSYFDSDGGVPELADEAVADEEVAGSSSELNARTSYGNSCSPFNAAYTERSMFYARTVADSDAFRSCVVNTMGERYRNCGDPNPTFTANRQATRVLEMLRRWNNEVRFECINEPGAASAGYQGHRTFDRHGVNLHDGYDRDFGDWAWYGNPSDPRSRPTQPWNWRASTMVHEFAHTHDFGHPAGCNNDGHPAGSALGDPFRQDCADPSCGWTTVCGGSGTPPTGMTLASAGEAQQEFCTWNMGEGDDEYFVNGEPSVPYILSECAARVVDVSHAICGRATVGCGVDQLNLVTRWTGSVDDTQAGTSCGCKDDPRREIILRTPSGRNVTATNGGGGNLNTNHGSLGGAWQRLFVIDQDGGLFRSGNPALVKTHAGNFVGSNFRADATSPILSSSLLRFIWSGGGPLVSGTQVSIGNSALTRYAQDDGTKLIAGTTGTRFTVETPVRSSLVYLRSHHGTYVHMDASGSRGMWNVRSSALLASNDVRVQRDAAFWMLDLNGGRLENNDRIVLEGFADEQYHYVSTSFEGTGQARGRNGFGTNETFVVVKLSGSSGSEIRHDDRIALRSSQGTYLTAMPADYFGGQIRNYGTFVGTWQGFTLRHVSQHDRARPTW